MAYLRREGQYSAAPRPALVLLDINMPKKNGFEVLSEMKDDPGLRTIPVVMLTTSSREGHIVAAYASGRLLVRDEAVSFDQPLPDGRPISSVTERLSSGSPEIEG